MTKATTAEELTRQMINRIDSLPRRLADGARYLVDHPDDVVLLSMREIANRAGVAPATLVRLARTLGYSDWSELRGLYADSFRSGPARYADKAVAAIGQDKGAGLLAETFRAQETSLGYAVASNTSDDIAAAARTLAQAERVYVAAFMSCRGPGLTFTYLCKMLRPNVELLGTEGSSLIADLAMLTDRDAVLSINFQPYAREIDLIADGVHASGASLVSLSDSRATPLQPHATTSLLFSAESPSFFPSVISAVGIVEGLAAAMLTELQNTAMERIGRIEEQLYDSGSYRARRRAR